MTTEPFLSQIPRSEKTNEGCIASLSSWGPQSGMANNLYRTSNPLPEALMPLVSEMCLKLSRSPMVTRRVKNCILLTYNVTLVSIMKHIIKGTTGYTASNYSGGRAFVSQGGGVNTALWLDPPKKYRAQLTGPPKSYRD